MIDRLVLLLSLVVVTFAAACRPPKGSAAITFTNPTPEPVQIFWIDSAGNLGLRGVTAVVPGVADESSKIASACRASAATNGKGTITVCMEPIVGRTLAEKLGLDWTSETSRKK